MPCNPLALFRGNRFNIVFYDAGALFYVAPLVKDFFKHVWQAPNQLLKAVSADLEIPEYFSWLQGIRDNQQSNHYRTTLESTRRQRYNMNEQYQTLLSCLNEWSSDATPVVSGNTVLFDDFPPTTDAIYDCLLHQVTMMI